MARFQTVFDVEPGVRLPQPFLHEMDQEADELARLEVRPKQRQAEGNRHFQSGLQMRCEVDAENVDEAIEKGRILVEGILSVLSFVSGVGLPPAKVWLAYDVSPQKEGRDFIQFFDPPHSQVSKGLVDLGAFSDVLQALGSLDVEDRATRLAKALRWYRLAARELDPLDRFSYYWLGLESLNPLLMEEVGGTRSTQTCPNCGHKWDLPDSGGVKALCIRDFEDGEELFRRLRHFRVSLQHGFGDIEEMYGEAEERAGQVRDILASAMLTLLHLDGLKGAVLQREVINAMPTRVSYPGVLSGQDPQNLGPPGMDPHLVVRDFTETVEVNDDGSVRITASVRYDASLGAGVRLTLGELRMRGESIRLEGASAKKV